MFSRKFLSRNEKNFFFGSKMGGGGVDLYMGSTYTRVNTGHEKLCNDVHSEHFFIHPSIAYSNLITRFSLQKQPGIKVELIPHILSLRFDKRKGFYCQVTSQGGSQCLGKGKGRHYDPLDSRSQQFLEGYYKTPNKELAELLQLFRQPLPSWLKQKR